MTDRFVWHDGDFEVTYPTALSDRWFRPLTPAEKRVQFSQIDDRINQLEQEYATELAPIYSSIKDDAIARLTAILESRDLSSLDGFELRETPRYTALIVNKMKQAYDYAKKGAADELGVEAPATRRETIQMFRQNASAVVAKQMGDLLFMVKTQVLADARKTGVAQLQIPQVVSKVASSFDTFQTAQVALGGSAAVAIAINRARDDVFTTARGDIAAYQYSALLDGRTCPTCAGLDGSVVDYAHYAATKWRPPIHLRCRCIFVAIKNDQIDIPSFTGFPDAPGGTTEPSL